MTDKANPFGQAKGPAPVGTVDMKADYDPESGTMGFGIDCAGWTPKISSTGHSIILASTGGFQRMGTPYLGRPVKANVTIMVEATPEDVLNGMTPAEIKSIMDDKGDKAAKPVIAAWNAIRTGAEIRKAIPDDAMTPRIKPIDPPKMAEAG